MNPILLTILMGIIAGICRSVLGFIKNCSDEEFSWGKLWKTVIIMAIAGGVIGLFTPNWKLAFAFSFAGGTAVNDIINAYLNQHK